MLVRKCPEKLIVWEPGSARLRVFQHGRKNKSRWPAESFALSEAWAPLQLVRSQFGVCQHSNAYCPLTLRYHHADARVVAGSVFQDSILALAQIQRYNVATQPSRTWMQTHGSQARAYYLGFDTGTEARERFEEMIRLLVKNYSSRRATASFEAIMEEAKLSRDLIQRQLRKSAEFWSQHPLADIVAKWPTNEIHDVWDAAMDLYLLGRLFTRFDAEKMQRGPLQCRVAMFREVKNAIIYAGQAHADFYHYVFKEIGVLPAHSFIQPQKDISTACIRFRAPFDFFKESDEEDEEEEAEDEYESAEENKSAEEAENEEDEAEDEW